MPFINLKITGKKPLYSASFVGKYVIRADGKMHKILWFNLGNMTYTICNGDFKTPLLHVRYSQQDILDLIRQGFWREVEEL